MKWKMMVLSGNISCKWNYARGKTEKASQEKEIWRTIIFKMMDSDGSVI